IKSVIYQTNTTKIRCICLFLSDIYTSWEKSPFGTIFPNDRSASPTVGKPSLHSHDVLPTVAFDAFRKGVKTPFGTTTKPSGH
ncbi:hypothetical protein, partial [Flavobacterium macacae]|uniref:hypothetical protein n=1 Tax=Flavobacterium macacae TaxID=2488993 RepID=UPI001F4077B6